METHTRTYRGHHCCAPRPRLGRLKTRNDGHPPTARLFSSPSRTSSPIQARSFRCFEASLWDDIWLAADSGYCGLGLAGGCDMTVLRRQWNTLCKSDTQAADMLLNSVAGGNWVRARKRAAHLVESAVCARCGQHDETEAHRLWECEHNNTFDLPPIPPAARTLRDAECPRSSSQVPDSRGHTTLQLQGGSHVRHHLSPPWRAQAGRLRGRLRRQGCI